MVAEFCFFCFFLFCITCAWSAFPSLTIPPLLCIALPPPTVNVITDGAFTIGEPLNVTCAVGVVDGLIVQPEIDWEKLAGSESDLANSISVVPSRLGNTLTLSYDPVKSSDAGRYTCRAAITNESIGVIDTTLTGEHARNITLQSRSCCQLYIWPLYPLTMA